MIYTSTKMFLQNCVVKKIECNVIFYFYEDVCNKSIIYISTNFSKPDLEKIQDSFYKKKIFWLK